MNIKPVAVCLIVVPCILSGRVAHATPCDPPCPTAPTTQMSPIEQLKSLFGVKTEEARVPLPQAAPPRPSAKKHRPAAIPLPRARPPMLDAAAFPPDVFAAATPAETAHEPVRPARLVDDAFNEISARDDAEYPGLKSALGALGARAGDAAP